MQTLISLASTPMVSSGHANIPIPIQSFYSDFKEKFVPFMEKRQSINRGHEKTWYTVTFPFSILYMQIYTFYTELRWYFIVRICPEFCNFMSQAFLIGKWQLKPHRRSNVTESLMLDVQLFLVNPVLYSLLMVLNFTYCIYIAFLCPSINVIFCN